MTWLEDNPEKRLILFSDSTEDAKAQGRKKKVGKSGKGVTYGEAATFVFGADELASVRASLKTKPEKYSKAVENCFTT